MGMFNGKKGPKPELAYAAVKTSNIASLKELLSKGCDPTAHHDEMVRLTHGVPSGRGGFEGLKGARAASEISALTPSRLTRRRESRGVDCAN